MKRVGKLDEERSSGRAKFGGNGETNHDHYTEQERRDTQLSTKRLISSQEDWHRYQSQWRAVRTSSDQSGDSLAISGPLPVHRVLA